MNAERLAKIFSRKPGHCLLIWSVKCRHFCYPYNIFEYVTLHIVRVHTLMTHLQRVYLKRIKIFENNFVNEYKDTCIWIRIFEFEQEIGHD